MLFFMFVAFVFGAIGVLILEVALFYMYLKSKPRNPPPKRHQYERARTADDLRNLDAILNKEETAHSLNALFAFLYGELKDTKMVRRWVVRKMNVELEELLRTKTAGRILEQITVRDYCLGPSVPNINKVALIKCESSSQGKAPEEVEIALDIQYNGGFRLSVDVDLVFGTSAYVSITVNKLKGKGRLSLSRFPYSHWSFSFFEDPEIEFETRTHFEGRTVPQLSGLIVNQIKKTIRRKHTLPAYKLRFKPFFVRPEPPATAEEAVVHDTKITVGKMHITVVECSRLPITKDNEESEIYCSLSIDPISWSQEEIERRCLGEIFELEIPKGQNKVIGVTFGVGSYEKEVLVSSVNPDSPAAAKDLRQGDRVLYVDEVKVQSPKQAARLIKQGREKYTVKIQRPFFASEESEVTRNSKMDQDDQKDIPQEEENDYEDFVNDTMIETFETLKVDKESRQRAPSPSRLEVPSADSPVLRRRGNSKQPTNDDGRRLSSSLDYETAKQLREKLQASAEDKLKNVKILIQESMHPTKESVKRIKQQMKDKVSGKFPAGSSPPAASYLSSVQKTDPLSSMIADPDTISLSSLSQYDDIDLPIPPVSAEESTPEVPKVAKTEETTQSTAPPPLEEIIQETTLAKACQNPRWDESFTFETKDNHKFINICVWNRIKGAFGERDIIFGFTSVRLMDVSLQCLTTLSGQYLEMFKLQPPELGAGASRNAAQAKVFHHPGYEHRLSFGDITLFFHHEPLEGVGPSDVKAKEEQAEMRKPAEPKKNGQEANERPRPHPHPRKTKQENIQNSTGPATKQQTNFHKFEGTHFSMPTRCDFCTKKVWTKFAFQCQVCHLICHKKCSDKTQVNIPCDKSKIYHQNIAQTSPAKVPSHLKLGNNSASTPSSPIAHRKGAPGMSPRASPTPSPQVSSSSSEDEGDDEDIETMVRRLGRLKRRLRQFSNSEGASCQESDAMVMTAAREMGRELFLDLPFDKRKTKLEGIINKLQAEIDKEAETQFTLYNKKEEAQPKDQFEAQFAFKKSEERMQTLAMLMLHYCSGIQHCNEKLQNQGEDDEEGTDGGSTKSKTSRVDENETTGGMSKVKSAPGSLADQNIADDVAVDVVDEREAVTEEEKAEDLENEPIREPVVHWQNNEDLSEQKSSPVKVADPAVDSSSSFGTPVVTLDDLTKEDNFSSFVNVSGPDSSATEEEESEAEDVNESMPQNEPSLKEGDQNIKRDDVGDKL